MLMPGFALSIIRAVCFAYACSKTAALLDALATNTIIIEKNIMFRTMKIIFSMTGEAAFFLLKNKNPLFSILFLRNAFNNTAIIRYVICAVIYCPYSAAPVSRICAY